LEQLTNTTHSDIPEDNPLSPFFQTLISTIIGAIFGGSGVIIGSARIDENGHASGGIRRMLVKLG